MEATKLVGDWMRPFPDVQDVFAGEVAKHDRHFQALLSIEAKKIDPAWRGWLHFVTTKEPFECNVGEHTATWQDGYTRTNWIALKRDQDGRYTFIGDWRYFLLEHNDLKLLSNCITRDDMEKLYADAEANIANTKAFYAQHGILNPWGQKDNPVEWFEGLGGLAWDGNYSWGEESFPIEREEGEGEDGPESYVHPMTHDGRRFRFVGWLAGFSYRDAAADGIMMFYDPAEDIVLFSFDWT
jgi:hypothetical protein